jgi:hypothetical protein
MGVFSAARAAANAAVPGVRDRALSADLSGLADEEADAALARCLQEGAGRVRARITADSRRGPCAAAPAGRRTAAV